MACSKPITKTLADLNQSKQQIIKSKHDSILASNLEKQRETESLMIIKSAISLYSWEDMQKMAGPIRITNTEFTGTGSVNDTRMGIVTQTLPAECPYCSQIDCPGHYGLIEFGVPIYNPAFIREIISILSCVCNDCGGLLVPEDVVIQKGWNHLSPDKRLVEMEKYCEGVNKCLRQKPQIGQGLILPCDSNPTFVTTDIKDKGEITYKRPEKGSKATKEDTIHIMSISSVMNILNRISEHDARLLGFPLGSHPRNMIMQGCLVVPTIARPPVYSDGAMHHDKLTYMYIAIKRKVDAIRANKSEAISDLYSAIKSLIYKTENNKIGLKGFLSIIERIQGKNALLRGLLMGKRNNFCARTVAGPDASLKFGQIRIPRVWAPILTKRITVTKFNIKHLQALFEKKQIIHLISRKTGLREFYGDRPEYKLKVGNIIERWLQNGDRVVINRQPTLHRQSKMKYEVVLGKPLTIGLHLSYTSPMNCDFDGDENNVWLPRDFEVEAETEIILNVKNNIMSSEQNRPIMGLVMNSISAAFLMTKSDCQIDEYLFEELLQLIVDKNNVATLEARLAKWGVAPYSGAALFSAMLPNNFYHNQSGVLIIDGILISGRIKKSAIGSTHRSIIQELHNKYREERTSDFFTEAAWILNKWIMERGFSVGLLDMINFAIDPETHIEYDKNERILAKELTKIYTQLETLGTKYDDPIEENYRMRQITNISDVANGIGIRLANEVLSQENSVGVMTEKGAGTKGSICNIGQMFGCVGQQFLYGERLPASITGNRRLLPIYDVDDNNPSAHGFIPTSFFTGLTPEGLFFIMAGGRTSLLDTALRTQDTGAMQHKMIKAFENAIIGYDGSIRNTIGTLFSPMYNSGYDVGEMMKVNCVGKTDFSCFVDIKSLAAELNIERGWISNDVNEIVTNKRNKLYPDYNPEELPDISPNINKVLGEISLNKFEKSRIIGARAIQLSNGDEPYVDMKNNTEIDPIKIATQEYEAGSLPLHVIRKYPDCTFYKVYKTKKVP